MCYRTWILVGLLLVTTTASAVNAPAAAGSRAASATATAAAQHGMTSATSLSNQTTPRRRQRLPYGAGFEARHPASGMRRRSR